MFKLEKIFQKDDNLYINISILLKSFLVYLLIYIFSILESNSIYDLFNFDIYIKSKYFHISIYFSIFYFLFSFIFRATKKRYVVHFFSFLLNDIIPFLITIPFTLYIFFIFKINYNLDLNIFYRWVSHFTGQIVLQNISKRTRSAKQSFSQAQFTYPWILK